MSVVVSIKGSLAEDLKTYKIISTTIASLSNPLNSRYSSYDYYPIFECIVIALRVLKAPEESSLNSIMLIDKCKAKTLSNGDFQAFQIFQKEHQNERCHIAEVQDQFL